MAKEKKRKKKETIQKETTQNDDTENIETTIDSYTGELKPVAEDADQFIEVVPEETDDRRGRNYLLNEESSMDMTKMLKKISMNDRTSLLEDEM